MYPAKELGGSTPTDKALAAAVEQVITITAGKDPTQNPGFIILATDGEPNDLCFGGKGGDGTLQRQCVISAVDRAAAAKIRTFVISLAGNDKRLQEHLVEVAKHGDPTNAMAHPYSPMNPNELVETLKTVLTAAVGCDLK
jgi:Mg-chelatase subunit ChlD